MITLNNKRNPSKIFKEFSGRTSDETLVDFYGENSGKTLVIFPVLTLKVLLSRKITDVNIRETGKVSEEIIGGIFTGNSG